MISTNWTKKQLQAIHKKNANILVASAARISAKQQYLLKEL